MTIACTIDELDDFAARAVPGSKITYFTALNAMNYNGLDRHLKERGSRALDSIVNRIRQLYNAGLVDLVQDRHVAHDETHYQAIWRKYPARITPGGELPLLGA